MSMKFTLRAPLALLAVVALLASCTMVAEGLYRVRLILERTMREGQARA